MKRYDHIVFVLLLTSCTNSDDSRDEQLTINVSEVNIETDTNRCIINQNAESAPQYLIGDQQAQNLIWNCSYYNLEFERRVEAYVRYDYYQQCFKVQTVIEDVGLCGTRAATPDVPQLSARIVNIYSGIPNAIGGSTYTVDFNANLENNGNVTAFDVKVDVYINDHFFTSFYPGPLLPGQNYGTEFTSRLFIEPGYTFGDNYTLRGEIRDSWNDVLLDVATVSIPIN